MADKYKTNNADLDKLFDIYKDKYSKVKNHNSERLETMRQDLELKQKGDKYQMMVVGIGMVAAIAGAVFIVKEANRNNSIL